MKALRKAKPIILDLGLPAYSAHHLVLAHKLEIIRCKDPDIKVIHDIMQQEANEMMLTELKEWLEDPRRWKTLNLFYS
jgi:hypothetical protein